MRSGNLGEVKRSGIVFAAEVRGLAHQLGRNQGTSVSICLRRRPWRRALQRRSRRSGFFRGTGAVASVLSPRRFTVSGLTGFQNAWFTHGLSTFTSGAAIGQAIEVKSHGKSSKRRNDRNLEQGSAAADAGADIHGHGGLRQACGDVPGEVRQRREFPRLSRHAGQRLPDRHQPARQIALRSSRTTSEIAPTTHGGGLDAAIVVAAARAWIGTPYHHQASLEGCRRRIASGSFAASGVISTAPKPNARRATRATGARRAGTRR